MPQSLPQSLPQDATGNSPRDADVLGQPLTLNNGVVLNNRIMKSAMSEVLADAEHAPDQRLVRLYQTWAEGGVGLAMTGNVMIDRYALGEPRNVVVEDERHLDALKRWAAAGHRNGAQLWMQINHPGKQSPRFLSKETVAPSAVPFAKDMQAAFATPRALEDHEIEQLIERFGRTAGIAKKAGFTGVQIHGAHGYLVNQFLSPHHNRRTDRWGGSLDNRSRFALEVYAAMRREVGDDFPVSIKINSADFQRGGFSEDESMDVIVALVDAGMNLVEVSGGNYEAPAMTGHKVRDSTRQREAYFLEFAERIRKRVDVPLAVTGGFRSSKGMAAAVRSGAVDLVGLARAMAVEPGFPARVLSSDSAESLVRQHTTGSRLVDKFTMLDVSWYENQLARIGDGKAPLPTLHPWRSVLRTLATNGVQAFQVRRARG